jgi:hypothetical protein
MSDSLAKMTDEQKRIRIAEHFGYKGVDGDWRFGCIDKDGDWHVQPPDWFGSLEVMHEAEMTLRGDARWQTYKQELRDVCDGWTPPEDPYHATAAQRAEAFLRTIESP